MIELAPLWAAFLIGLLGSTHCVGMCGSIVGLFAFASPNQTPKHKLFYTLIFNIGRIASYTLIGFIAGLLSYMLGKSLGDNAAIFLRIIASVILFLLGLSFILPSTILQYLEKAGAFLWKKLSPITKYFLPVNNPYQAFFLGSVWGWLPCGLVYSTLAFAMSSTSWLQSGLTMLAFGVGTLPMLLGLGFLSQPMILWIKKPFVRTFAGLCLISLSLWSIYQFLPIETNIHHH